MKVLSLDKDLRKKYVQELADIEDKLIPCQNNIIKLNKMKDRIFKKLIKLNGMKSPKQSANSEGNTK